MEVTSPNFAQSVWIRIGDKRVDAKRDAAMGTFAPLTRERVSFYVHVDELSPTPPGSGGISSRLPTVASIARSERAKAGVRDVGDEVAALLRSCDTLDKMYAVASEYLADPVENLRKKYGHLNHGQQRMNLGNRMRAKWRKTHA